MQQNFSEREVNDTEVFKEFARVDKERFNLNADVTKFRARVEEVSRAA